MQLMTMSMTWKSTPVSPPPIKTKAELEKLLQTREVDAKFVAAQLKEDPKDAHYLEWQESPKVQIEETRAA